MSQKKVVYLYDGPVRNRKSTKCLQYELKTCEGNIFYVARTVKNLEESFRTCREYLQEEFAGWKVLFITGKNTTCDILDKDACAADYQAEIIRKCTHCPHKMRKVAHNENIRILVQETPYLVNAVIKAVAVSNRVCPNRLAYSLRQERKQLIFLTYAGLRNLSSSEIDETRDVVIFDEARNILSLSNMKSITIGNGKSFEDCIKSYINNIFGILQRTETKVRKTYREEMQVAVIEYLGHLQDMLKDEKKDLDLLKPDKREWLVQFIEDKVFKKEWFHKKRSKVEVDLDLEKLHDYLTSRLSKRWDDWSYRLFHVIDTLQLMQKYEACFEYIKLYNTLNFVLYDKEERSHLHTLIRQAHRVNLIDSTPFSIDMYTIWLHNEFTIKKISKEIYNNNLIDFKFNIIVMDRIVDTNRKSFNDKNYAQLLGDLRLIEQWAKKEGKQILYFAKSKEHREKILAQIDSYSKLVKEEPFVKNYKVMYSRSSDSEGVQRDEDFVISIGLPLQNIDSEEYRKYEFARRLEEVEEHEDKYKADKLIDYYRKQVAYQYLVQQSFRCAKVGKDSGCVWIGVKSDDVENMKKIYPWLKLCTFIYVPRHIQKREDRVNMILEGLQFGRSDELNKTMEEKIFVIRQVLNSQGQITMSQLKLLVKGKYEDFKTVIDIMQARDEVEIVTQRFPKKIYLKLTKKD